MEKVKSKIQRCQAKVEMSYSYQIRNVRFYGVAWSSLLALSIALAGTSRDDLLLVSARFLALVSCRLFLSRWRMSIS